MHALSMLFNFMLRNIESAGETGSSNNNSSSLYEPGFGAPAAVGSVSSTESAGSGGGLAPPAAGAVTQHGTSAGSAATATAGAKRGSHAEDQPAPKRSRASGDQVDEFALLKEEGQPYRRS